MGFVAHQALQHRHRPTQTPDARGDTKGRERTSFHDSQGQRHPHPGSLWTHRLLTTSTDAHGGRAVSAARVHPQQPGAESSLHGGALCPWEGVRAWQSQSQGRLQTRTHTQAEPRCGSVGCRVPWQSASRLGAACRPGGQTLDGTTQVREGALCRQNQSQTEVQASPRRGGCSESSLTQPLWLVHWPGWS